MPISFDFFSRKVRDIGGPDIEALTSPQRAAFKAVEAALAARDSLENRLTEMQADTKEKAFAWDKARLHMLHVQPQRSVAEISLDEKRRMMLPPAERMRLARLPVDPEILAATEAAALSNTAFEASKKRLREIQSELADSKSVASNEIVKFQKLFVAPTPTELLRGYVNAEHERRKNGTELAQPDEPTILAPIDAYMRGSKGPLGVRSARQQSRHPDGPGSGNVYPASWQGRTVKPPKPALAPWQVKPMGAK